MKDLKWKWDAEKSLMEYLQKSDKIVMNSPLFLTTLKYNTNGRNPDSITVK